MDIKQKLNSKNNRKDKVEVICDSKLYAKNAIGQFLILYYLVSWKSYLELENIWKPTSIVMHF